jgi:hypothetical protein
MRGICLAAAMVATLLVTSCDGTTGQAIEFCTVFCECEEAPVDALQQQCVDQCVGEAGGFIERLPPACFSCISENRGRCLSIEAVCEPVCDVDIDDDDPPPPDPIDPPVIIDAGLPEPDAF